MLLLWLNYFTQHAFVHPAGHGALSPEASLAQHGFVQPCGQGDLTEVFESAGAVQQVAQPTVPSVNVIASALSLINESILKIP